MRRAAVRAPARAAGLAAGLALALVPGSASAHAFSTGRDAYGNFLEGAATALANPVLLLPVLAVSVALALWREEGLLAAWPYALAGSVVGLAAAPFAGPSIAAVAMGFGLVVAVLAALVPLGRIAPALPVLAGLVMAAVFASALQGHSFGEVPMATRVGLLFGGHFALSAGAGVVRLARSRVAHPAMTIFWRVVASWIAAILVLYLAFSFRG